MGLTLGRRAEGFLLDCNEAAVRKENCGKGGNKIGQENKVM